MGKGGYTIIDFKDVTLNLNSIAKKIDGIYNQCEEALKNRKPVLVSNITLTVINEEEGYNESYINDFFSTLRVSNNGDMQFDLVFLDAILVVHNNDTITFEV